MTKLSEIEGIGTGCAEKLNACGVPTLEQLLIKGANPAGRTVLARESGISSKFISKWVNRADLARVKGIGGEYADLLECSGVDTVPELATRNAADLHGKLTAVNTEEKLVKSLPALSKIEGWVEQAKKIPRAIHFYDPID